MCALHKSGSEKRSLPACSAHSCMVGKSEVMAEVALGPGKRVRSGLSVFLGRPLPGTKLGELPYGIRRLIWSAATHIRHKLNTFSR
jgi:hypothetical protein